LGDAVMTSYALSLANIIRKSLVTAGTFSWLLAKYYVNDMQQT